jgi:hypothetical protein
MRTAPDEGRERQILDWVVQNAEQDTPITKGEINDYCLTQIQIQITRGRMNSLVFHHSSEVIQTRSTPRKEQLLRVPRTFLERTIRDLNKHVQGCVAELVFNLDEIDISDLEDRETRKVIVPGAMDGQRIHHAVSRNVKHPSVI